MKNSLVLLLSAMLPAAALAAEYTVTSSADSGDGTLRQLITDAAAGDTINIPGGMTITLSSEINWRDKPLDIVGDPADMPVLAGNGSCRLFIFERGNVPYRFRNLKFANYSFTGNGSAIYMNYTPNLAHISNCVFQAIATTGSAAVYCANARNILIEDCSFVGCSATAGYAAIVSSYGPLNVERCTFSGNSAQNNSSCFNCTARWNMTDCVFANNVGKQGGAVTVNGNNISNGFTRCLFVDNNATDSGGAIWARNHYTLRDCTFLRNHANDAGGAIFRYNGRIEYYNCVFEENSTEGATNWQGGAAVFGRDDGTNGGIISNCVFRGNYIMKANGVCGAFYGYGSKSPLLFMDCLFEGNRCLQNAGAIKIVGAADVVNCTFKDNYCSNGVSAVWIGTGDISENRPDVMDVRPVNIENCTFYGNDTYSGRGCIWIDNAKNQTYYFDANDVMVPDNHIGNYLKNNPGEPVTTNKINALDHVSLRHCTFVGNTMAANWGTLYVNSSDVTTSRVDVAACLFHGNLYNGTTPKDISGAVRTINYTSTDQAGNGWTIREPENSANNYFGGALGDLKLDAAPAANGTEKEFVDGTFLPTLGFAISSPLRDKVPVTLATDARGMTRGSVGDLADIGAYERIPFVPTVILIK